MLLNKGKKLLTALRAWAWQVSCGSSHLLTQLDQCPLLPGEQSGMAFVTEMLVFLFHM